MLLALATLGGCWRPDPYTPPATPVEEPAAEAAPGDAPPEEPPEAGDAAGEAGAETEEGALAGEEPVEEDEDIPPFAAYAARTVQAPVTIVDDWGKPLAVLGRTGWEVEVRGEEEIRTRVWCGSCSPAVEGWIQPHLIAPVR